MQLIWELNSCLKANRSFETRIKTGVNYETSTSSYFQQSRYHCSFAGRLCAESDSPVLCIFGFIRPYRMRKWTVAPCHCWAKFLLALLRPGVIRHRIEIKKFLYFSNHWSQKDDLPLILIRNGQFKGLCAQDNWIWATKRLRKVEKVKFWAKKEPKR